MPIHLSVDPIECEIHESYLYNLDPKMDRWLKAKIIGLSSYKDHSLTLHILIEESGAIFSYMPLDSVRHRAARHGQVIYSYKELDYHFCPDDNIVSVNLTYLKSASIIVFIKRAVSEILIREPAEYICTIDWPDSNSLQHLVKLINNG